MPAIAIPPSLAALAVPIESLHPHPANARQHDVGLLIDSLRYHGQYRPLVVQQSTGYVLAGNGTLIAARDLGWNDIAVTYVDVDDEAATRILLIDNRSSDLAGYDDLALTELLTGLGDNDLTGTGFDHAALTELLASVKPEPPPDGFPSYDEETIATEHRCPRCGYEYSGKGG